MIYPAEANCRWCVHYLGERRCKAFVEFIPDEFWSGRNQHHQPVDGDNGYQFQKKRFDLPVDD